MKKLSTMMLATALSVSCLSASCLPILAAEDSAEKTSDVQTQGPVVLNKKAYTTINDAIAAANTGDTITITANYNGRADVPKDKTLTIVVESGVVWTNQSDKPLSGWSNSVVENDGNLTLINKGTIQAHKNVGSSFTVFNKGEITIQGGNFISDNGDYVMKNQGVMTIGENAFIDRTSVGSTSAVISNGTKAQIIMNAVTINANSSKKGIGLRNTEGSTAILNNPTIHANVVIQNDSTMEIKGGNYYTANTPKFNNCILANMEKASLKVSGGNFYYEENDQGTVPSFWYKGSPESTNIQLTGGTYWNVKEAVSPYIPEGLEFLQIQQTPSERWTIGVPAAELSIDPKEATLKVGQTQAFNLSVKPEDAAGIPSWQVSDPSIAAIAGSADGKQVMIEAKKAGTATLTVTYQGKTAEVKITVEKKASGGGSGSTTKPGGSTTPSKPQQPAENQIPLYRLYNPNSGEHFYTKSVNERDTLVKLGWQDEGIGWYSPTDSSVPVYRLYNPNAGDHHYTKMENEKDHLVKVGWKYEGIGFYSLPDNQGVKVYREYNPNAKMAGAHNYTTSKGENDFLISIGWLDEGIGWWAAQAGVPAK